jgi:ribosomal protein L24
VTEPKRRSTARGLSPGDLVYVRRGNNRGTDTGILAAIREHKGRLYVEYTSDTNGGKYLVEIERVRKQRKRRPGDPAPPPPPWDE